MPVFSVDCCLLCIFPWHANWLQISTYGINPVRSRPSGSSGAWVHLPSCGLLWYPVVFHAQHMSQPSQSSFLDDEVHSLLFRLISYVFVAHFVFPCNTQESSLKLVVCGIQLFLLWDIVRGHSSALYSIVVLTWPVIHTVSLWPLGWRVCSSIHLVAFQTEHFTYLLSLQYNHKSLLDIVIVIWFINKFYTSCAAAQCHMNKAAAIDYFWSRVLAAWPHVNLVRLALLQCWSCVANHTVL